MTSDELIDAWERAVKDFTFAVSRVVDAERELAAAERSGRHPDDQAIIATMIVERTAAANGSVVRLAELSKQMVELANSVRFPPAPFDAMSIANQYAGGGRAAISDALNTARAAAVGLRAKARAKQAIVGAVAIAAKQMKDHDAHDPEFGKLVRALDEMFRRGKRISYGAAAKAIGVPKSTLQERLTTGKWKHAAESLGLLDMFATAKASTVRKLKGPGAQYAHGIQRGNDEGDE